VSAAVCPISETASAARRLTKIRIGEGEMIPSPLEAKLDVSLRVANLEASGAWYSRIFGTEPLYRGVDRSVNGKATSMVCFRLGGVKFWLLPRLSCGASDVSSLAQRVGLAFMTRQPLGPLRQELAARGASFDDTPMPGFPIDHLGIRVGQDAEFFYLLDLDGYKLEFCRVFAKSDLPAA
jgi:catechol 2,3-dioxygenase-like lactoylglutathione lyase family enzyme